MALPSSGIAAAPARARGRGSVSAWALAGLCGILYLAAFPPLDLGTLGFVALVPLLLGLRGMHRGRAFLLGWAAGTIAICGLVSGSLYEAGTRYFGDASLVLGLFALLVAQLHGALYFGLFAWLVCGWERRSAPAALASIATAWTACDFARANLGWGCPWVLLGHSQHERLWIIQVADLAGVFGVSFAVAVVNAVLALVADAPGRQRRRGVVAAVLLGAALLAALWLHGERQLSHWQAARLGRNPLRVLLVQPNLALPGRASLTALPKNLRRLLELSAVGAGDAPDLIVWPENAVGFSLAANPSLLAAATRGLPESSRLLLGAPRDVASPAGVTFRNSAFLLDRAGDIAGTTDKIRLTPFAETFPWAWIPFLQRRFAAGDLYAPGERLELFEVKRTRFATLICSEAIYPDLVRQAVAAGAQWLVNISNDDWFGQRAALQQHLVAVLFRAVESRRFLVRATNSGVTAVIDPRGAIVAEAPAAAASTLTAAVVPLDEITPYERFGDLFAWTCVLGCALFAMEGLRRRW